MNLTIRTIFRSNIWAFPVFAIVLWATNWLLAEEPISYRQVLPVSLLFAVYYNWGFYIAVGLFWGTWKKRIGAIGFMLVLLLTIETTLEFLIYRYFPVFDVYLDQNMLFDDYVHDPVEFRRRWVSALVFIFLLILIRLAFRVIRRKIKEDRESRKQIGKLHSLLKSRHLNPHFMENFVAITFAKEKRNPGKENEKMLMMLTQLMHYQLAMDSSRQITNWEDEWEQVDNLFKMASYCDAGFFYEWDYSEGLADMQITIPHGLLLMPLENALKYGKNVKRWPLRLSLHQSDGKIYICCTNYFSAMQRGRMRSSGMGFQLMEARLTGGSWPITLRKREEGDLFCVEMEITLIDGKINNR